MKAMKVNLKDQVGKISTGPPTWYAELFKSEKTRIFLE